MISGIDFDQPVDKMKLFFDWEYPITDKISIFQPSVQDIIDYDGGEEAFMFLIHIFTGNTTYFRVSLWEQGIDWNNLTDWELFVSLIKSVKPEATKVILGDLDFTKMQIFPIEEDLPESEDISEEDSEENKDKHQKFILYDSENDIEFNEITYLRIRNYFRYMFNIFPKVEVGIKKKRVKREIIEYDKKLLERQKKENPSASFLFPIISTLLVYPGFKYKKEELRQVGIVELLDAAQRVQVIENSLAVMRGMYSGFVDGSKIKPESYNFMKDLNNEKKITDAREIALNSVTSSNETWNK